MTPALRRFRDGLIVVALYFTACAMVSDAHPDTRKDIDMSTASTPAPAATPALSPWHAHTDAPATRIKAIILLQPAGAEPVTLPELYVWDTAEGYWISASSHLRIRHKEFLWAEVYPLLELPTIPAQAGPGPWQRDEEATAELLSVVGIDIDGESVAGWEDHQVRDAENWAAAVHLRASDGAVRVPPMPMFLRDCQRSPS